MLRHDMEGHWSEYKNVQDQIFTELHAEETSPAPRQIELISPHFECVRCHQKFLTYEAIQQHYSRTPLGGNPIVLAQSRRGYTEESWVRGQRIINAPTIKSVQG